MILSASMLPMNRVDGMTLGHNGTAFVPNDYDTDNGRRNSHAIYQRTNCTYGVDIVCDREENRSYLRIAPAWQLPPFARNKRGFLRFLFEEVDDDRAGVIRLDPEDGEVRCWIDVDRSQGSDPDPEMLGELIDGYLGFLDSMYPQVVAYVAKQAKGKFDD